MPQQYDDIKQSYLDRGKDLKDAKRIASMTYIKRGNTGTRSTRAKSLQTDRTTGR